MKVRLRNEYSPPPASAMEEARAKGWKEGGDGGVHISRISYPVASETPEKERSEVYRFKVLDLELPNPSAYQLHNAKSLHETLGRKKNNQLNI